MNILKITEEIEDPRIEGKVIHNFSSIIFAALCWILCGCESWSDIEEYCESKREWLSDYVDLSNGIPSAWTFRRVFTLLDPDKIEQLLRTHASSVIENSKKETKQIAVLLQNWGLSNNISAKS